MNDEQEIARRKRQMLHGMLQPWLYKNSKHGAHYQRVDKSGNPYDVLMNPVGQVLYDQEGAYE